MKKLLKILVILFVVFMVLVIAGVLAIGASINGLAKKGVEEGATYALGVTTKVQGVQVGLFSGKFGLTGLDVTNPGGYTAPSFLKLGQANVAVSYDSLQQPTVVLPELVLRDIAVDLEKKEGKSNYQVILDNLKKLQSSQGGGGTAGGGEEKKFVISKLLIENVDIKVNLIEAPGALNQLTTLEIPIEKIELENVGKTGEGVAGTGVTMKELTSIIVQAVLGAAAQKGSGILPADLLGDLQGQLSNLGGLKDMPMQVEGVMKDAAKKAEEAVKNVTGSIGDTGKKLIEGILPGQKKKEDEKK